MIKALTGFEFTSGIQFLKTVLLALQFELIKLVYLGEAPYKISRTVFFSRLKPAKTGFPTRCLWHRGEAEGEEAHMQALVLVGNGVHRNYTQRLIPGAQNAPGGGSTAAAGPRLCPTSNCRGSRRGSGGG